MTAARCHLKLLLMLAIVLHSVTWYVYLPPLMKSKSEIFNWKSEDAKGASMDNHLNRSADDTNKYNDRFNTPSSRIAKHKLGFQYLPDRSNRSTVQLPSVCSNELCRPDYFRYLQSHDEHPIPGIRHILWRNESVSEYFAHQLRSWHRIHPNWTFVLWRDQDLVPFVAKYFPGLLAKFKSLKEQIMRVDMVRYLLLFKFGGVYADLDYSLVESLDDFRRFPAVVTREPDVHSLQCFGMSWPVRPLFSSAFMMSTPGHIFYHFVMQQLEAKEATETLGFAGPFGLTTILEKYQSVFPLANTPMEAVYVPPSYSFYPYPGNRLRNSKSVYVNWRMDSLRAACHSLMSSQKPEDQQLKRNANLLQYCTDVNNLDPVTDRLQRVFAIHDLNKPGAIYAATGASFYYSNLTDARTVIRGLKLGNEF